MYSDIRSRIQAVHETVKEVQDLVSMHERNSSTAHSLLSGHHLRLFEEHKGLYNEHQQRKKEHQGLFEEHKERKKEHDVLFHEHKERKEEHIELAKGHRMINWQITDQGSTTEQSLSDVVSKEKAILGEIVDSVTRLDELALEGKDIKSIAEDLEIALQDALAKMDSAYVTTVREVRG